MTEKVYRLESELQADALDFGHVRGWFGHKVEFKGRRGGPDTVFIRQGRTIWIEFKKPGEVPTRQQEKVHQEMRAKGATVYWADSMEQVREILR